MNSNLSMFKMVLTMLKGHHYYWMGKGMFSSFPATQNAQSTRAVQILKMLKFRGLIQNSSGPSGISFLLQSIKRRLCHNHLVESKVFMIEGNHLTREIFVEGLIEMLHTLLELRVVKINTVARGDQFLQV